MTIPASPAGRRLGTLLLADISGYTGFLGGVANAHHALVVEAPEPPVAYALLSHLLDRIVTAVGPTFRLAKLEGDAVFAVADGAVPTGEAFIAAVHGWYAAFREAMDTARANWTCSCSACIRVGDLDLKFIVHHGAWFEQSIAGMRELAGPDVNVAHRLLKNHAREVIGARPYALFTDSAAEALGLATADMASITESPDGASPIEAHVLVLG